MRCIRSAGQNVSPADDGRLYDQIFEDGLFEDMTFANLGLNNIAISDIYGIICGRDFTCEAQTIQVVLPEEDVTATGYIYIEINTAADEVISINSALSPFTPTYEDINTSGAICQMVLAQYTATQLVIESITPVYKLASAGGVGSLASIEMSPAKANHGVGTYIVYDGVLYKVRQAIVAGEDLVIGTNIVSAKVGTELKSLNDGLNNIGTRINGTSSVSSGDTLDASWQTAGTVQITAGTWVLFGALTFNGSSSAVTVRFNVDSGANRSSVNALPSGNASAFVSHPYTVTSTTTITFQVYGINNPKVVSPGAVIYALRIK